MKDKHIGLDLPSVIGMGISGPVLACLTASIFAAFKGLFGWGDASYAVIMLFLSGMLAMFPTAKTKYSLVLKMAMWPVATVVIFASAWGANSGISAGEEAMSSKTEPELVIPMAPVTTVHHGTNDWHHRAWTNQQSSVNGSTNQVRSHRGFFKR